MCRHSLYIIFLIFIGLNAIAQDQLPDNFFLKKLDNGLDVLVIENPSVPIATIEICVKNGAYTESPEYDGLSHLYEHMFFKANKTYTSQEAFMERMRELGIVFNGTTSQERVNYFITLHKNNLQYGIEFLNDAIRYPLFIEEEMRKENPVVAGEFQRNESNPSFFLRDAMKHAVWGDLYSRKNTIGDYDIIYTATTKKMNIIKDKYYYPNNSILAVAGDVEHEEIFEMAQNILGSWEPCDFDPFEKWPIPEFKPLQYSTQLIVENENARIPVFMQNWHGPDTRNDIEATYAGDVFIFILSQQTSKLQKAMVDSGLCSSLQFHYSTAKHVGEISIIMVPKPKRVEEAINMLKSHITQWDSDDYFTDEQMETALNLISIRDAYAREKSSEYIHTMTFWWASASLDYYSTYLDKLKEVTREDIKEFIRTYIKGKPHVTGLLSNPSYRENANIDDFFTDTYNTFEKYTIQFEQNNVKLNDSTHKSIVNSLVQWLNINPNANINIDAYMDKSEEKGTNRARYDAVLNLLIDKNIDQKRIIGTSNKKHQVHTLKGKTDKSIQSIRKVSFSIVKQ